MDNERKINLEVYEPSDFSIRWDKPSKRLGLFWVWETAAYNIILMRIISIGLQWPWIKCITAFTDRD